MSISRATFNQKAIKSLAAMCTQQGVTASPEQVQDVVLELGSLFEEYALKVRDKDALHRVIDGVVRWTPERDAIIKELCQKMNVAFAGIVDSSSKISKGTLWSGPAKHRALAKSQEAAAVALESTLWGRFLEDITFDMNDCFFPGAYTAGHEIQTAGSLLIWDATSSAFTQKFEGDVEVTLLEGDTRSQSVFFNTELPRLRALQSQGIVNDIYLSTFTDEAKKTYNEMLEVKERNKTLIKELMKSASENQDEIRSLAQEIETHNENISLYIKDGRHWQKSLLDKKAGLTFSTGGKTGKKGSASFSMMLGLGDKWKGKISSLGDAITPLLDRVKLINERREQLDSLKVLDDGSFLMSGLSLQFHTKPPHRNQPSQKASLAKKKGRKPTVQTEFFKKAGASKPVAADKADSTDPIPEGERKRGDNSRDSPRPSALGFYSGGTDKSKKKKKEEEKGPLHVKGKGFSGL